MADITKCVNDSCPLRETCYRVQAPTGPYRQSMSHFKFTLENGEAKCDNYWPIETKKEEL